MNASLTDVQTARARFLADAIEQAIVSDPELLMSIVGVAAPTVLQSLRDDPEAVLTSLEPWIVLLHDALGFVRDGDITQRLVDRLGRLG